MKDQDWDLIWDVHVKGSYKVLGLYERADFDRLRKPAGPYFESKSMAESSIPRPLLVSMVHSAKQITLLRN
jgi:hypothetical protein